MSFKYCINFLLWSPLLSISWGLLKSWFFNLVILVHSEPDIICIQETNFKSYKVIKLKNYEIHYKNRTNLHASGGVAIYVHEKIYNKNIQTKSDLESVVAEINIGNKKISICNVYWIIKLLYYNFKNNYLFYYLIINWTKKVAQYIIEFIFKKL